MSSKLATSVGWTCLLRGPHHLSCASRPYLTLLHSTSNRDVLRTMSLAILPRALGGPWTSRGFRSRASGLPISPSATYGKAYNSELVRLRRFDLAVKSGLPKPCRQNGHQFYHSHPRFATSMSVGREVRYGIHLRLKREVPAAVERCIH